ncbi:VOC family protein [Flavobacterium kingsejongi]|uniref:VOC family virulence protein n=1 Tax=Flavobacterium kingsejongi TaxID=1678728 RepID=A0A2S1LNB6_9FLAO|nr:VOC family protein [Flavobacterium kingsejongi]AWG25209.1 VOC family virulence protein [Flavobacterium kingsejongi]
MEIQNLDHVVLTVADLTVTCNFYQEVLGMEVLTFGGGRKALRFGNQKINLHQKGYEIQPAAAFPTKGSADLCFIAITPISEILTELYQKGIAVLEGGVVQRTGAMGKMASVYFRDPDLNLIEVSNYR